MYRRSGGVNSTWPQGDGLTWPHLAVVGCGVDASVTAGANLDDVAAEGESVDNGGAKSGVGERLGPAAEAVVFTSNMAIHPATVNTLAGCG